jgi:hypothetical protein
MIAMLVAMFMIFGIILSSIGSYMPPEYKMFQVFFFILGMAVASIGLIILFTRARKTGAIHLLEPAQPGKMIWFYIQKDGTVKVTPAVKEKEGMTQCKELSDAIVQDTKAYRLFDHSVRFVPEDVGHTANHLHCLYAMVMKNKYGYEDIKDGRKKILGGR